MKNQISKLLCFDLDGTLGQHKTMISSEYCSNFQNATTYSWLAPVLVAVFMHKWTIFP